MNSRWLRVLRSIHIFKNFGGRPPWLPVAYLGDRRFAVGKTVKDEVPGSSSRMRKLMASIIVVCARAVSAQEKAPPGDFNQRLLEELRLLRVEVAALGKKIEALEERLRKDEEPWGSASMPDRHGPDREALAGIKLPEDPTREQVLEYVRAIVRASRGQSAQDSKTPRDRLPPPPPLVKEKELRASLLGKRDHGTLTGSEAFWTFWTHSVGRSLGSAGVRQPRRAG